MCQQRLVEYVARIARHQPRADKRVRVDVAGAEYMPLRVLDNRGLSGFECGQRGRLRVDFVAEDPNMPRAQPAAFVFLEARDRKSIVGHGWSKKIQARLRRGARCPSP